MRPLKSIAPEKLGPHWREGLWTHTAIGAGGTQVHITNVYGWPPGTPDQWKNQNTLWKEMFNHIANLGDVPWGMAGNWNATPDQLWVPALAPRASGWLPDVRGRRPTCFPVKGAPMEKDSFLVNHCLRGAVTDYEFLPVVVLPTQKAVRLTSSWPLSKNRSKPSKSPRLSRTLSLARTPPSRPTGAMGQAKGRSPRGPASLGRLDRGGGGLASE